jgi:phosphoribosylglycinamide formyltransferase 1
MVRIGKARLLPFSRPDRSARGQTPRVESVKGIAVHEQKGMMGADRERRIGVLISGRGSNLQALIDAVRSGALDARIAVVISNRPGAAGLDRARDAGIEALVLDHRDQQQFPSRIDYDRAVARALQSRQVSLVCLAGFMRLIGPPLLEAFPDAILNVHPSLLPAFPGVDAQRQAIEHGVKVTGATVHLVTGDLDGGPIVLQSAVPVLDDDTVESLSERILIEEHRIYPEAVRIVLDRRWRLEGRRVRPSACQPAND